MLLHARRIAFAVVVFAALGVASSAGAVGLTCARHEDVVVAAEEALVSDHPLRGTSYIVGRVDEIRRGAHAPITLVVTPTHQFSGDQPDRLRLAARSDGPPDPAGWEVGGFYFLALVEAPDVDGADRLVAPCAPNFLITSADQLDRLMRAAPAVELRDVAPTFASVLGPPLPIFVALTLATAIGIGSWLAFARRRSDGAEHHRN